MKADVGQEVGKALKKALEGLVLHLYEGRVTSVEIPLQPNTGCHLSSKNFLIQLSFLHSYAIFRYVHRHGGLVSSCFQQS